MSPNVETLHFDLSPDLDLTHGLLRKTALRVFLCRTVFVRPFKYHLISLQPSVREIAGAESAPPPLQAVTGAEIAQAVPNARFLMYGHLSMTCKGQIKVNRPLSMVSNI